MTTLKVGLIGCGAFADAQDMPNFKRNQQVDVKWCCDVSPDRARNLADKFGIKKITSDFMEIINDPEVDLIKISTSHEVHLPIIEAAAAKGKHIFCEKPLAMNEEDALKIIGAVRRNKVKLCVDLNRRMSPSMFRLKQRWLDHCRTPRHQAWRYVETEREPFPEEKQTQLLIRIQDESSSYRLVHLDPLRGGGQIIGETVHWLDLACWFFAPDYPVEINAFGSSRFSHAVNMRFSSGNTASIIFNCGGTFDYPKELIEVASNGALFRNLFFVENEYFGVPGLDREIFPLQNDPLPEVGKDGGFEGYMAKYYHCVRNLKNSKGKFGSLSVDKGHQNMFDGFVRSIIENRPSPCNEQDGYMAVALARLAMRSIELRQSLPVPLEKVVLQHVGVAKN